MIHVLQVKYLKFLCLIVEYINIFKSKRKLIQFKKMSYYWIDYYKDLITLIICDLSIGYLALDYNYFIYKTYTREKICLIKANF